MKYIVVARNLAISVGPFDTEHEALDYAAMQNTWTNFGVPEAFVVVAITEP